MLHRLLLLHLLLCSAIVAPDTLTVYDIKARRIRRFPIDNGDWFVKVFHNNRHFGTTQVKYNNSSPEWEESFSYGEASSGSMLRLKVYDKKVGYDRLLGICEIIIRRGRYEGFCFLPRGGYVKCRYILQ